MRSENFMNEESKYMYPVEELDKIIDKINRGISPMMNDQLALEVKLRYKELENELFDTEEDVDDEDVQAHQEMMKKHIEQNKRKATRRSSVVIKLTEDQMNEIRDNMETSIVRENPNSQYNIPDDELYSSEERRNIYKRLSKLKNCYYNQIDYTNAIKIISEAVEYSLTHDYPWLTKSEAYKQFKEGKIKFTYCNIPKLYINWSTQVTDPDILKGIVSGEVTLKSKDEKPKRKPRSKESVLYDYNIIGDSECKRMEALHAQGYDTPISPMIKSKSSMFNRLSVPNSNMFVVGGGKNSNKEEEPELFDWTREGAGAEYFRKKHNIQTTSSDIIDFVNKQNDRMISNVIKNNTREFLHSMKTIQVTDKGYSYKSNSNDISNSLKVNPEAARIEAGILQAMRMNNPDK